MRLGVHRQMRIPVEVWRNRIGLAMGRGDMASHIALDAERPMAVRTYMGFVAAFVCVRHDVFGKSRILK
jgi:hypothetical protein